MVEILLNLKFRIQIENLASDFMSFKRADRVSEAIKREISLMLGREVKDPGIHFVTVTAVETTDDLRHAKVFVSVLGDKKTRQESMDGLERAKGF